MTSVTDNDPTTSHIGDLRLRRFRVGELAATEHDEVARHTTACGSCRGRLRALDDEQRQFERDIPFERFTGGVERARRVDRAQTVHQGQGRRAWTMGLLGFAAAAATLVVVISQRAPDGRLQPVTNDGFNNLKGTSVESVLRIAGANGQQRSATAGSTLALAAGERVRIGVRNDRRQYVFALSIDDQGQVSALYPERGASQPFGPQRELAYLPDSFEFVGAGHERVFVLVSAQPLVDADMVKLAEQARAAHHGDVRTLQSLPISNRSDVQQFSWLIRKP